MMPKLNSWGVTSKVYTVAMRVFAYLQAIFCKYDIRMSPSEL
jgi:hypothetical protein